MQNSTRVFLGLAGAGLLFIGSAFCLANLSLPADLSPVNDPWFGLALTTWYWLAGGLASGAGLACLLAKEMKWAAGIVTLLAAGFLGARLYTSLADLSDGWGGYLAPLGGVFGWRGTMADSVLLITSAALLAGSFIVLWREHRLGKANNRVRT